VIFNIFSCPRPRGRSYTCNRVRTTPFAPYPGVAVLASINKNSVHSKLSNKLQFVVNAIFFINLTQVPTPGYGRRTQLQAQKHPLGRGQEINGCIFHSPLYDRLSYRLSRVTSSSCSTYSLFSRTLTVTVTVVPAFV